MCPKTRVLNYTRLEKLAGKKHSCLLGPFASYKENETFYNSNIGATTFSKMTLHPATDTQHTVLIF